MKRSIKFLSFGTALSSLGVAGYTAHHFLYDNSIGGILKGKGHKLLSFDTTKEDDRDVWTTIAMSYATSEEKINGLIIASSAKNDINSLKKRMWEDNKFK